MRHFFTKNTVEAQIYCKRCGKETLWKVAGGRPLHCTACYGEAKPVEKKTEQVQEELF